MKALDLIHMVPKVEKRLSDDLSRKIYEIRINYAIYRNTQTLMNEVINLSDKWNVPLKSTEMIDKVQKVIIFGSGEWGRHTLDVLRRSKYKNLEIKFCDNDSNKWCEVGYAGLEIINPKEAIKLENSIIIIGSWMYKKEMRQQLLDMGYPEEQICMPLLGWKGWQYFDYFNPNEDEIFVDGGCYDGKTAVDFTKWASKGYDYIYAFEANANSINICQNTIKQHELKGKIIDKGLWNKKDTLNFTTNGTSRSEASRISEDGNEIIETITLDEILNGKRVTFIKMDIEGAEYNALLGAEQTIRKWHPRLAICVYHKPEDILEISDLLLKMNPDYKFALRTYISNGDDTVLYAY